MDGQTVDGRQIRVNRDFYRNEDSSTRKTKILPLRKDDDSSMEKNEDSRLEK